jgi:hypothetical protein
MKKSALLGIALCIMAGANAQWGKKIKGNGNMVRTERSTGDYEGIAVSGFFNVELVAGTEGEVTVHAEENLQEYIITEVERGTLVIKTEKGVNISPSSGNREIRIVVPVDEIESVALSGSGDIVGNTLLKSNDFKASMSGSGDIRLEVECEEISASMSGSGDMNLKGETGRFNVQISGSGDIEAFGLNAREVDATISGSADINVTANELLKARVSGSGNIRYRGNPAKIDSKSSGSGDISRG